MAVNDAVGAYGERVAAAALVEAGMEILETNWRCPHGELDIVAWDGAAGEVVFVEVKTRRSVRYGHPAEAVAGAKLRRIRQLAALWLRLHRPRDGGVRGLRIDVVAVWPSASGPARVEHLRGVG